MEVLKTCTLLKGIIMNNGFKDHEYIPEGWVYTFSVWKRGKSDLSHYVCVSDGIGYKELGHRFNPLHWLY